MFFHQKVRTSTSAEPSPLVRKMFELDNPPADVFYGRLLIGFLKLFASFWKLFRSN